MEETKISGIYRFGELPFYRDDQEGILERYCSQHNTPWAYTHYTCLQEEVYKEIFHSNKLKPKLEERGKHLKWLASQEKCHRKICSRRRFYVDCG